MGKHKPVHTVEKCDEWLSTRTKRKITTTNAGKKTCLSRPLRNIGNVLLTNNSTLPSELQTHTKQSTLTNFYNKLTKLPELYNVEDEQLESSEELPSLTCNKYIHDRGDNQETDNDELPICTGDHCSNDRRFKNQDTCVQLPLITGNQYSTKEGGDNQHGTVPLELPTIANAKNHENAQRKYNNQDTENEELCPLVMIRHCISPAIHNRKSTINVLCNHKNNENDKSVPIDDEFIEHTDSSSSLEQFNVISFSNQDMTTQTLSPGYTRLHSNNSFTEKSHLKPRYFDLHVSNMSQSNLSESNVDHLSEVINSRRPKGDNPDYNNSRMKGMKVQNESNRENCCYIDTVYDHTDNTEQQNSNQSCRETDCSHSNVDNLTEIEIDILCPNESRFNVKGTTQDKYTETDNRFYLDLMTQDTVSINHYRTDILKSDLDEKTEVRSPFKNSTKFSDRSSLLNLDIMSEVSEIGSGINLISTQEADLELENFSIDNDSQLDL